MGMAHNFIYIEDQYFVDESIGRALAKQMAHLNALIIVICDTEMVNGELYQAYERRRLVFDHLLPHAAKVAVVFRNNRYVHAKTWIFDDTIAMVSSSNINRRGMEHDSELGVAFGDVGGIGTVREMRERLWSLHLGTDAPAAGSDPIASLDTWKKPPAGAAISPYRWSEGIDDHPVPNVLNLFLDEDQFWEIVDPPCP
jgi:phosphatidylserine/phosphatidylglycerophosphate/cardiolipin synthase-like enzyme